MSTKRRRSDGEGYKARAIKAVKSISGLRRMYAKDLLLAKSKYVSRRGMTPEIKNIDTGLAGTNLTSSGGMTLLNGCSEGTDIGNRVGRKIEMTSATVSFSVAATITTLSTASYPQEANWIKVALVYDKQSNTIAPNFSDIFTVSATTRAPYGQRDVNYTDRFDVLKTWNLQICAQGPNAAYAIDEYIPMKLPVKYDASNAGNITDITSGALYLVYCDSNQVAGNYTVLNGQCRVRFRDM